MITKSDRGEWVIPDEDVEELRTMRALCPNNLNPEPGFRASLNSILPDPEEEPAPCPWTGSSAVATQDDAGYWFVRAQGGARGPREDSRDEAVATWNQVAGPVETNS